MSDRPFLRWLGYALQVCGYIGAPISAIAGAIYWLKHASWPSWSLASVLYDRGYDRVPFAWAGVERIAAAVFDWPLWIDFIVFGIGLGWLLAAANQEPT